MPRFDTVTLQIPAELLPADGRFGSGPSRVRPEAVAALAAAADGFLGTSHRQPAVRDQVGRLRAGLHALFGLPDDWEILLGNGGTTLFWDAAAFGLISHRSAHGTHGEFSSKFASVATDAPFLEDPVVTRAEPGTAAIVEAVDGVDTYCLTHNETSTGVAVAPLRPSGADDGSLVIVDATSAAGGIGWNTADVDVYYFAPQKALASDGGLWLAACSPAAVERIEAIAASDRWVPPGLDLQIALDNSRKNQTYNTPALTTVFLAAEQVDWINDAGGLAWADERCRTSSGHLYRWAEEHAHAEPFVKDPAVRSPVVATIDFDDTVDAAAVAATLRANGIVDVEPYRKLGRNQLRVATFPAVPPSDVEALIACIDWVLAQG